MDSREPPSAPPSHHHPPPPGMSPPPNSYPPSTTLIPPNSASSMQNPSYSFNYGAAADGQFPSGGGGGGGFSVETTKKKRGRPRKYSPDGNTALGLSPNPNPSSVAGAVVPVNAAAAESGGGGGAASDPSKRGRGRPPGSGKKQLDAMGGPAGISFTPHVILVKAGEDICSKIMAFSQQGPRTVCLLSANGAISNASICHSTLTGGTVTYEGRYEIISLRGSFTPSESNVGRSRTGGLSVTLSGADGQVIGGSLSGTLIAASPVQIIVGSFIEDGKKPKPVPVPSQSPVPNMLNFSAPVAAASPPSQGPSSESSDENGGGSPYDGGSGNYTNINQQPYNNMPMYSHSGWGTGQ